MITVTPAAAEQIRESISAGNIEKPKLRIAVTERGDGSFHYGMGFDELKEDDIEIRQEDFSIIIDANHGAMLNGTTLDYVEIEAGAYNFIFVNPNEPDYSPPTE